MINVVLAAALAAYAAPPSKTPPSKDASRKIVAPQETAKPMEWKGQNGGSDEPGHRLINDARGWEALWRVIGKDKPSLDFKTHVAVAVFLGQKPTGGWSVAFAEPVEKDGDTMVAYTAKAPKGFTTQAFTSPYVVRAVKRPLKGKVVVLEAREE